MLNLEVVHVVLTQGNLVDINKINKSQYEQKSEVLYIFTPIKSQAYLLNIEPSNLVFFKTYSTEFDKHLNIY